jgi:pSer/pThr/pTyr-binding forkhead associated (FHA) protein
MKTVVKIGRDKSNDIVINEPRISRNHAIITDLGNKIYEIKDLGSTNGTFVNGERITQQTIIPDDKIEVATCLVNWVSAFNEKNISETEAVVQEDPYSKVYKTILVGASSQCDIVMSESVVSNQHAKISLLKNGDYYIQDLGSSNGTYVNGARIMSKNFTKTDLVKIASVDLSQNWFLHKKLIPKLFKDHKTAWLISLSLLLIAAATTMIYLNSCKWFEWGCNLSAKQIYSKNKNCLVHVVHDFYYTIEFNGKSYFVGKNKTFKVTEANTSKENLLPYNSVSGTGCFIRNDGTILTSSFIINPWLNETEKFTMLNEVIESKTIKDFSLDQAYQICGETSELKWLSEGLVNHPQNYLAANSVNSCILTDDINITIQSIKKELPENADIINCFYDTLSENHLNKTSVYYYSAKHINEPIPTSTFQDTFYSAIDSFDINKLIFADINKQLPDLSEGSIVLNERGELVGNIQFQKIVFVPQYYKQIKN